MDIARARLHNQRLVAGRFYRPEDVVQWLGAVQSQDFAGATWAVGQRTTGVTEAAFERAFAAGAILRTHVLRPTWHFVTPADIRWMLALTGPRVKARTVYSHRRLGLDETIFARSNAVLRDAVQGGAQPTRAEIAVALQRAGVLNDDTLPLSHLLMRAELDGIVCSGAKRDKQQTYALLDDRAPQAKTLTREESLAELARRYFTSHGPATLRDYVWWSGLTMADARAGVEMARAHLASDAINGQTYWFAASIPPVPDAVPTAYLLPNYDEYAVAYADRSAIFDARHAAHLDTRQNPIFSNTVAINGQVVGTWKRTPKKDAVVIEVSPFMSLNDAENAAVTDAAERYGAFLGLPVHLRVTS